MMDREEKKINEALLKGTDEITELKNIVWNNIESQLDLKKGNRIDMKGKKNNLRRFFKYGSIAAAIAIVAIANTQYGSAAVNKIKEMFTPSKTVEEKIEGIGEKKNVSLQEGSSKYIIYIDEKLYSMKTVEGKDIITPKVKAENLPQVFMEIQQVEGKTPEALAAEKVKALKENYKRVENMGKVNEPISGILIYANSGSKWNDIVEKYYFVDNTKGGTIIIKQQYFVEASEGHGSRFDNMLKEFKIVNQ